MKIWNIYRFCWILMKIWNIYRFCWIWCNGDPCVRLWWYPVSGYGGTCPAVVVTEVVTYCTGSGDLLYRQWCHAVPAVVTPQCLPAVLTQQCLPGRWSRWHYCATTCPLPITPPGTLHYTHHHRARGGYMHSGVWQWCRVHWAPFGYNDKLCKHAHFGHHEISIFLVQKPPLSDT